jgi:hypothetical protein
LTSPSPQAPVSVLSDQTWEIAIYGRGGSIMEVPSKLHTVDFPFSTAFLSVSLENRPCSCTQSSSFALIALFNRREITLRVFGEIEGAQLVIPMLLTLLALVVAWDRITVWH